MSHAAVALAASCSPSSQEIQSPAHSLPPSAESVLRDLAHELRQPLSAMETIAYYLEIILPPHEEKAREHLVRMQQLIVQASGILDTAVGRSPVE